MTFDEALEEYLLAKVLIAFPDISEKEVRIRLVEAEFVPTTSSRRLSGCKMSIGREEVTALIIVDMPSFGNRENLIKLLPLERVTFGDEANTYNAEQYYKKCQRADYVELTKHKAVVYTVKYAHDM